MDNQELKAIFDRMASGYDEKWARTAPIREGLYFLLEPVFAVLPKDARILCVGAGTGAELAHLAAKFPRWSFTIVEPSGAMLEVCRQRAEAGGFSARCHFHEGYLNSLPIMDPHDGATCFLVSQFILDREARSTFFREIADRLRPGGILASSDLASQVGSEEHSALMSVWLRLMASADTSPEGLEQMRAAYEKDVAILPPATIASIVESGDFENPVQFYQAGLIHAWFSKRKIRGTS